MAELELLSGHLSLLLSQLSEQQRSKLIMGIARKVRKSQRNRIAKQQNPNGGKYIPRKKLKKPSQPISFIYQKPNGQKRLVDMKSYRPSKTRYFGYDQQAGGIRTFLKSRIVKYLPSQGTAQVFRGKKGQIRQTMFNKLKNNQYLKIEKASYGVAIGFTEAISRIANVHQYGLRDRVDLHDSITTQYNKRELLGFTETEIEMIENELLQYFSQ